MKKAKYFHDNGWTGHTDLYFKDNISICLNYYPLIEKGKYNVAVVVEPDGILFSDSKTASIFKNKLEEFDLVLTWQDGMINNMSNTKFLPYGTSWVDEKNLTYNKQDMVSFITSNKTMTFGHIMRHRIFNLFSFMQNINGMPYKQIMTPPRIDKKEEVLDEYKFSIVIENEKEKNWFTEKLIDCFVSKTIPIYWGCPNIDEFFDVNGMIIAEDENDLIKKILTVVKPGEYEKRLDSINKNYHLCQKYRDFYKNLENAINEHFYGEVK